LYSNKNNKENNFSWHYLNNMLVYSQ
jgi:hypothetical protein